MSQKPADQKGFLQLPLAAILVCVTFAGLGTWGVLRLWRHRAELQLRLDACVSNKALELKSTLLEVDHANDRIQDLRVAIALAVAQPEVTATLQAALRAQVLAQDAIRLRWTGMRALWLARRGCDSSGDWPLPLPDLPYRRPPPDVLGPRPLEIISVGVGNFDRTPKHSLRIALNRPPRYSAAVVERTHVNAENSEISIRALGWQAHWVPPMGVRPGAG